MVIKYKERFSIQTFPYLYPRKNIKKQVNKLQIHSINQPFSLGFERLYRGDRGRFMLFFGVVLK